MKKLGRPRKAHALRKENISVNLPKTLVSTLESKLSYNGSRSKWIETAIESRLEQQKTLNNHDSKELVTELYVRGILQVDEQVRLKTLIAEIEAEQ